MLTNDESVRLITPDILRDAGLNAEWTSAAAGRETQRLMGVPADQVRELTLQESMAIMQALVLSEQDIVWMVEYDNEAACRLSQKLGFEEDDDPYTDTSGQEWQNVVLRQ